MKYNVITYIGRFQCPHRGHIGTIRSGLDQSNRLIIVIGSHNTPRDIVNPWTAAERESMIRMCFNEADNSRMSFVYAENRLYSNSFWARNVELLVNEEIAKFNFINPTIAIIGNGKGDEQTGKYIDLFKQWTRIKGACISVADTPLHATTIRKSLFTGHMAEIEPLVEPVIYEYLQDFTETETFANLKYEYDFHIKEEQKYYPCPYNNYNRYCADAVVIQSGHVLLIQRIKAPGRGLWALPGGHVEQTETAFEASLRELDEETSIKLQPEVLERCMFLEHTFDHPERSLVGRLTEKRVRAVTRAFGYKLEDSRDFPKIAAGDDAGDARWYSFAEIGSMRDQLFEDHADIIEYMLARVPEKKI